MSAPRSRPVARSLVWCVQTYQVSRAGRPSPCRFTPSCSHFAEEAVLSFGPARAVPLVLARLARCHPFHPGGYDPLPHG